ncbi:hypothetical protein A4X13_0g7963 [Tilletia indica]|uniref:Uncharacterized protein n=1 Tax=Tilletia indica TaxID=43049 RepID=A0A177TWM3_9BASI|nr:hypothetical protein A4X13_0g7963 [Tilletia indica]
MTSTRSQLDYVDVPMTGRSSRLEISDDDQEGNEQDVTEPRQDAEPSTSAVLEDDDELDAQNNAAAGKTPRRASRRTPAKGRKQAPRRKRSISTPSKADPPLKPTRTTRQSRAKALSNTEDEGAQGPAANDIVPYAGPSANAGPILDANAVERLNAGEVAQTVRATIKSSVPSAHGDSETRLALAVKASIAACIAACLD